MTRQSSESDLAETMLYNLNSGPDTLAALVKTLDFLSEAVCAMASSNAISLDYSADGLHYLLQHLGSLIKRAADECEEEISQTLSDRQRLVLFEQLYQLYDKQKSLVPPANKSDDCDHKLLRQIRSLEKQLAQFAKTQSSNQISITHESTKHSGYSLFSTTYSLTCQPADYGIY